MRQGLSATTSLCGGSFSSALRGRNGRGSIILPPVNAVTSECFSLGEGKKRLKTGKSKAMQLAVAPNKEGVGKNFGPAPSDSLT